ncbi:hypothetical protein ACFL0U_01690 [Pseudomonadota bacterium]
MTTLQILASLGIILFFTLRPFAYRPAAKAFTTKTSAAFTSIWMLIGIIVTLPFFGHMLFYEGGTYLNSQFIIYSLLKGWVLWVGIRLSQVINAESVSSSVFSGPIVIGLAVILNVMFFGEILTAIQFISIFLIGLTSLLFFTFGHAKFLSTRAKKYFLISILLGIYCVISDQIVISNTNWYVHTFFVTVSLSLISVFSKLSIEEWKDCFLQKSSIFAGFVFVTGEFYLMSVMVRVIPVSIAALSIRLSIPFIMILSSLFYNEQKWQTQAVFAVLLLLSTVPIILF